MARNFALSASRSSAGSCGALRSSPSQAHAQGDASCLAPYASSRAWLEVERSYVHAHADELGAPCHERPA
jgi:hypothetical protein